VANRVAEIQQLRPIQYWHVRSEENPADPLSRSVMPNALIALNFWWSGLSWSQNKNSWSQNFPSSEKNLQEYSTNSNHKIPPISIAKKNQATLPSKDNSE